MNPDTIMEGLAKELHSAMKAMAKTKDLNEKEAYSRIIKNLCEAQGVFLKLATEMMSMEPYDDYEDDEDDDEDIPF